MTSFEALCKYSSILYYPLVDGIKDDPEQYMNTYEYSINVFEQYGCNTTYQYINTIRAEATSGFENDHLWIHGVVELPLIRTADKGNLTIPNLSKTY